MEETTNFGTDFVKVEELWETVFWRCEIDEAEVEDCPEP